LDSNSTALYLKYRHLFKGRFEPIRVVYCCSGVFWNSEISHFKTVHS